MRIMSHEENLETSSEASYEAIHTPGGKHAREGKRLAQTLLLGVGSSPKTSTKTSLRKPFS